MRGSIVIVVGLVVSMAAVPATLAADGTASVREENRAWVLERNPGFQAEETVALYGGEEVEHLTAERALERVLDRAGDTPLATLTSPAWHGTDEQVGDMWLMGWGNVDCGESSRLVRQPFWTPWGAQLWIYEGYVGYTTGASADEWYAISWSTKDTVTGSGTIHYGGISDFFCIEGDSFELLFPFIDGYSTTLASPPVLVDDPIEDPP